MRQRARYFSNRRAGRGPDQASLWQWPGLRIKTVQGIPSAGRYPARTRSAVPPADQREVGALPPGVEEGREPTALRCAGGTGGCDREVHRLLQLSPVSQGTQGHHPGRHAGRPKGRNPRQERGGEGQEDQQTKTIEPRHQGAAQTSLISLLPKPSHFAEVQHRGKAPRSRCPVVSPSRPRRSSSAHGSRCPDYPRPLHARTSLPGYDLR